MNAWEIFDWLVGIGLHVDSRIEEVAEVIAWDALDSPGGGPIFSFGAL